MQEIGFGKSQIAELEEERWILILESNIMHAWFRLREAWGTNHGRFKSISPPVMGGLIIFRCSQLWSSRYLLCSGFPLCGTDVVIEGPDKWTLRSVLLNLFCSNVRPYTGMRITQILFWFFAFKCNHEELIFFMAPFLPDYRFPVQQPGPWIPTFL